MKKIFFSILTLFLFLFTSHQVVSADQAIDASIRSDGQDTLRIKVENHQEQALNHVNYQLDLPKGYELVDDLPTLQELGSQQSHEFDVKVKKTAESLPNTGEKWVKWTVIGLALLALLFVAYYYVKTRKVLFLLFLVAGILGLGGLVKAAPIYQELAVGQRVTLFGVELPVTLHIYYDEEGEVATPAQKESGSEDMAKETESSATSSQTEEPTATLPTMETPVAPTPSVPSQPSVDTPVVPTPDVPSHPSVDTPVAPMPSVPSHPSVETPVAPVPSVPSQPSVDTPVVPTPDVPSHPSVDTPVTPVPSVPSQPSIDTPVVPTPDVPSQPSVDTPVAPTPEVPSQPSVDTPVAPEPTVPSQPSVDTPVVPTPDVPSQPSVDTPVVPTPEVPSQPSVETPVAPTPEVPSQPSVDTPVVPEPTVPSQPSVDTPVAPAPEVPSQPSQPSVDTPAPSDPSEDVPVKPIPSTPENPSEDIAIPGETEQTPPEEVLISGYAYSGTTNKALEETNITISAPSVETRTVETEVDGYFYTHLLKGITYTLNAKDFKVSLTANGNNDFQVDNILGRFSAGKQTKTESGEVVLQPSVVQFDTVVDYVVSEKDHHVTLPEERKLNPGDIIVLPSSGTYPTGFAYKVVSSTVVNGKTEIVVADAKLEEVAKDIKYHETFGVDQATFHPVEGVTLLDDSDGNTLGNRSSEISKTKKAEVDINGFKFIVTLKGKVEADADVFKGKMHVKPSLDLNVVSEFHTSVEFKGETKVFDMTFATQSGVTIGTEVYLFANANGEINFKTSSNFNASYEVGLKNWQPYNEPKLSFSNALDISVKGKAKMGPKLVLKPGFLNMSGIEFNAAIGLGLEGELSAKITSKNKDIKVDKGQGKLLFFGDSTLGYKFDFLGFKKEGDFIKDKRFFEKWLSGQFDINDYPLYKEQVLNDARQSNSDTYKTLENDQPMFALYDINKDSYPELVYLANNKVEKIYSVRDRINDSEPKLEWVAGIGSNLDKLYVRRPANSFKVYEDGSILKYLETSSTYPDVIDRKWYLINKIHQIKSYDRDMVYRVADYTSEIEENHVNFSGYDFTGENTDKDTYADKKALDEHFIKSPEVDWSKVPQYSIDDYYGGKVFIPYREKDVDLHRWLGFKHALLRYSDDAKRADDNGSYNFRVDGYKYNDEIDKIIKEPVTYAFYDIDGNGYPELIIRKGDRILQVIASTNGTSQVKYHTSYTENLSVNFDAWSLPDNRYVYFSDVAQGYTTSTEDGSVPHLPNSSVKIYKDGMIRIFLEGAPKDGDLTNYVFYQKLNKEKPRVYGIAGYYSTIKKGLDNYYNPARTEHKTIDELDKRYLHAEEIDYNSLNWKVLKDFHWDEDEDVA